MTRNVASAPRNCAADAIETSAQREDDREDVKDILRSISFTSSPRNPQLPKRALVAAAAGGHSGVGWHRPNLQRHSSSRRRWLVTVDPLERIDQDVYLLE